MNIVDGSMIDVTDESWVDTIRRIGVLDGDKIAILDKEGREYAFFPVNEAQKILLEEITNELVNVGSFNKVI